MSKIPNNVLFGYIILIIVGALTSFLGIFFVKKYENNSAINTPTIVTSTPIIVTNTPIQTSSQYPDYEAIQKLHYLELATDFETWTPGGEKAKNKVINTLIIEKGEIVKGYLYIKASLNEQALTKWESIFVMMNYEGGHLFRPQTLAVPPSEKTELLYALNEVPYLKKLPYSETRVPDKVNWFGFFGDNKKINIEAFISSLKVAKIEKMILYYDCVDSNDCKIDSII